MSVVRGLCREVVCAVLFLGGGTPIHSFVHPPALRRALRSAGDLTPNIFCDRLAKRRRLNQTYARQVTPSPLATSDWLGVDEGFSLPKQEVPMPTVLTTTRSSV